jgi:hypothetical protein
MRSDGPEGAEGLAYDRAMVQVRQGNVVVVFVEPDQLRVAHFTMRPQDEHAVLAADSRTRARVVCALALESEKLRSSSAGRRTSDP